MELRSGTSPNALRLMRFLMGFLLASALILIEIGAAELLMEKDARCREAINSGRFSLDPNSVCISEGVGYLIKTLSKGPFAAVRSDVTPVVAWLVTGISYGLLGGFLAQFPPRSALGIFFGFHLIAILVITVLAYISTFVA